MMRRPLCGILLPLALLVLAGACASPPESPQLRQEVALRQAMLEWAVLGEPPQGIECPFPDGHMLWRYTTIVIQDDGSPASRRLSLPGRTVRLLDSGAIRARANSEGDYLYLRFDRVELQDDRARVRLSLVWAVSKATRDSGRAPQSSCGAEVAFQLEGDTWTASQVLALWQP